jgi:hypothetical protein
MDGAFIKLMKKAPVIPHLTRLTFQMLPDFKMLGLFKSKMFQKGIHPVQVKVIQ